MTGDPSQDCPASEQPELSPESGGTAWPRLTPLLPKAGPTELSPRRLPLTRGVLTRTSPPCARSAASHVGRNVCVSGPPAAGSCRRRALDRPPLAVGRIRRHRHRRTGCQAHRRRHSGQRLTLSIWYSRADEVPSRFEACALRRRRWRSTGLAPFRAAVCFEHHALPCSKCCGGVLPRGAGCQSTARASETVRWVWCGNRRSLGNDSWHW